MNAVFKRLVGSGLWLLLALLMMSSQAMAATVSQNDLNSIYNNTVWYDANGSSAGCSNTIIPSNATEGTIDLLMEAIAIHESGGDPKAQNNPNDPTSASGKYQMIQSTWQNLARQYYAPAQQYAKAADAPENIQDAVAYLAFGSEATKQYNAFQIAMGWYGGAGVLNDIAANFNVVPKGNTMTYGQYGDEIVDFMKAGKADDAIAVKYGDTPRYGGKLLSSIPIDPQSAPDFATYLTKLGKPVPPIRVVDYGPDGKPVAGSEASVSSPAGNYSSSCTGGGGSSVPSGNFVFYNQGDPRWANHLIYTANDGGTDTIGAAGCGPTSVAMIVATLADSSITPVDTGDYMTSLGSGVGYTSDGATANGLSKAVERWGLSTQSVGSFNDAIKVLKQGGLVIAGGAGLSPFSKGGHVIVLRGLDSSGNFLIGNPAPNLQNGQDEGFSAAQLQAAGLSYMIGVTK